MLNLLLLLLLRLCLLNLLLLLLLRLCLLMLNMLLLLLLLLPSTCCKCLEIDAFSFFNSISSSQHVLQASLFLGKSVVWP